MLSMDMYNATRETMRSAARAFSGVAFALLVEQIARIMPGVQQVVICDSSHSFDPDRRPVIAVLDDEGLHVDPEKTRVMGPVADEALRALELGGPPFEEGLQGQAVVLPVGDGETLGAEQIRILLSVSDQLAGSSETTFEFEALLALSDIPLGEEAPDLLLVARQDERYVIEALKLEQSFADVEREARDRGLSEALVLNLRTEIATWLIEAQ